MWIAIVAMLVALVAHSTVDAQAENPSFAIYLSQTNRTTDIAPAAAPMIEDLRGEVQKVLDAGPLAPLRTVYADLLQDPYFVYWQPARIITTLAMAYPYLTPEQQAKAKTYVRTELDDPARAPWCEKGHLPPDIGARREIHAFHEPLGWDRYWAMWGRHKPIMGSFYGLWLYADRTGDWDAIQRHYPQIVKLYESRQSECNLYGTIGASIALARIARHVHDEKTAAAAEEAARSSLESSLHFEAVEDRTKVYWKERYEPRERKLVYQGWMFLDVCPEVGRFLHDRVKDDVLQRNADALKRYPLFWLREVPYWSRWTGDEGLGIPTELMGMIVPIQRWVAQTPADELARYTRSAPICIGDCYWLEMLVNAIESTGKTEWKVE